MQLFFLHILQYIQSITFIQYIHPSPFAEVPLHLFIAGQLSGKKTPWAAEPRIELPTTLQQADALPSEFHHMTSHWLCSTFSTGQRKETKFFVQQFNMLFLKNSPLIVSQNRLELIICPFWSYAAEISLGWLYWPARSSAYNHRVHILTRNETGLVHGGRMEHPYSPNLSDSAECVILCTSWLQSPGKVSQQVGTFEWAVGTKFATGVNEAGGKLPLVWTKTVANLVLRISPRIFEKY